jgi:hypothetical protein
VEALAAVTQSDVGVEVPDGKPHPSLVTRAIQAEKLLLIAKEVGLFHPRHEDLWMLSQITI